MLYLVPTPIGNLEDMTLRAIRVLGEVDQILAEDTRTSGVLLKHYNINTELKPYHSFNEHKVVDHLVTQMSNGMQLALITDAGTPGISDPGFLLVRACRKNNIPVTCLPGAAAFVPALAASGLPSDAFYFEGFLPHKKGRQTALKRLAELQSTFILYESPHRVLKCLEELAEHCGPERNASAAREISKKFEEQITAPLETLIGHFQLHAPKGEFVIVVEGKK